MSKRVKALIENEFDSRFHDLEAVAVINPRGINANRNNAIRRKLHGQGLKMMVVKNTLARRAAGKTRLKGMDQLLEGPCAVVYGKASISAIARLLLDEKKTNDKLELRGVFFDGEVYVGEQGVTQVSKLPTREEAIGLIVAAMLSPAKKLAGAIKSPGSRLASILKTIEEKARERGEVAPEATPAAEAAAPPAEAAAAPAEAAEPPAGGEPPANEPQ
jgi:large subunit ribosomal protein L10